MSIPLRLFLRERGLSNSEAKKHLKSGKIWLCGVPTADGGRLIQPDQVEIKQNAPRMIVGRDPVIVHRDTGFVVVWKPANYLSVPARNRKKQYSASSFVHRVVGQAHVVHRLDEGTSGLLLVATDEKMQFQLKSALEQRTIHRRYLALVLGKVSSGFTIRNSLVRNRGDGLRGSGSQQDGKVAVTHIKPVEKLQGMTLVEAELETGRTHQIRIHLSEAGYPVLGDQLYASRRAKMLSPRLALHAWQLALTHPVTKQKLNFMAPLADDLEQLRRHNKR